MSYHILTGSSRKPRMQDANVLVAYLHMQLYIYMSYHILTGSSRKPRTQAANVLVAYLHMQLYIIIYICLTTSLITGSSRKPRTQAANVLVAYLHMQLYIYILYICITLNYILIPICHANPFCRRTLRNTPGKKVRTEFQNLWPFRHKKN